MNTGGDQYQTVTIVPSDGNTGEVSYVLIVQQPEDKNKNDGDEAIGVYDFENDNDFDEGDDDNLDDKTKIRKIKPSQQVKENDHTKSSDNILQITISTRIYRVKIMVV